ncbi:MAG: FtsK/SpoIIIE domain-containing protein, partial [Actinomycetota bacterium]
MLTAEAETPIEDVARALSALAPGEFFVRGSRLDGPMQLASGNLRDGDVVTVNWADPDANIGIDLGADMELAAIGGPMSGRRWPLAAGWVVLGRSSAATLRVEDPALSRRHFRLTVGYDSGVIEDLGSTNGTWVDGRRLEGSTTIRPGQVIEAGATLFEIRPRVRGDADVHPDEAGGLAFNRPARIRRASLELKVAMPAKPSGSERQPFPWVQVGAPAAMGVAGAFMFGPASLLFAGMSLTTSLANRRLSAKRSRGQEDHYAAELAEMEAKIADAAARELAEARYQFPDPATLGAIATGPSRRLWERRAHDLDATLLRVGVADRPASVVITGGGRDTALEAPRLATVPVGVDLAWAGVLGVAGPQSDTRAVARWLIAQLATLRSPRDLQLTLLTDADAEADWDWMRWLPHARVEDAQFPLAMVGNDRGTREERIRELLKLLDARIEAAREEHITSFTPSFVVVFDGIRALRSLPGVPRLLKEGPAVGIYAIGLDTEVTRLAEEGRAQLVFSRDDRSLATLEVDGAEPLRRVLLDQVDAAWADEVARGLAPIRDAGGEEGEAVIPKFARFVDLAGIDLDRSDEVVSSWMLGGRSTEALVGASIDGHFTVDLKRDGPHALVAGTTGSGKSEFLQTLVVSLALANRPNVMNFVLIDYKGGGAFADCERLPHTVGMVTNLDGHLTERALVSLDAELKRREQALKEMRASDIDTAWERDGERAAAAGLARLAIVIDEFAELVHELPDFVMGLIRIARVGRSLGVHLILATQRPAGVVSPEMRANTGMRVALRMVDKADSTEVLEAPNAANIARSTPGRGFVRTGGQAALVEFQTARVAGRRKGATVALPPPRIDRAPWSRLGYPPPAPKRVTEEASSATDLHALVEIIEQAAAELAIPRSKSPWLPPLPTLIGLPEADQEPATVDGAGRLSSVVFGMEDIPARQTRRSITFDVAQGGHLLIA